MAFIGNSLDILSGDGHQTFCLQDSNEQAAFLLVLNPETKIVSRYTVSGPASGDQQDFKASIGLSKETLICALDSTHLAVSQVKDALTGDFGVGIWDLKFNALKAWQATPGDTHEPPSYVAVANNNLVLGVSSGVYMCHVSVASSTLSSVLGSLKNVASPSTEQRPHDLRNSIESLLDKTKDYSSFRSAFKVFMKAVRARREEVILVRRELDLLITRCIQEKTFFPEKELVQIVTESLVPANLCMSVIRKLMEVDNLTAVHSCLTRIQDMPESVIVECVQYFLGVDAAKFPGSSDEEMEEVGGVRCPFSPGQAAFINSAMMIPVNDVFLQHSLKKLSYDNALRLVDYLKCVKTFFEVQRKLLEQQE